MSYNPTNIKSALKTLLTNVTGIANVYDKYKTNVDGFPAIVFAQTNDVSEMLDDTHNIHDVTYTAEIWVETTVEGLDGADALLDTAVNNVISAIELKTNASLSGNVDWIIPTSGRSQQMETAQGVACMKEVIIRCKIATSIL